MQKDFSNDDQHVQIYIYAGELWKDLKPVFSKNWNFILIWSCYSAVDQYEMACCKHGWSVVLCDLTWAYEVFLMIIFHSRMTCFSFKKCTLVKNYQCWSDGILLHVFLQWYSFLGLPASKYTGSTTTSFFTVTTQAGKPSFRLQSLEGHKSQHLLFV